jgi:hypothetical protein
MSETYDWNSKVPAKVEEREFQLPPIGEYNFIVLSAEKTFSNNGNPMIKVRLDLQGADGSVFDNLVISDNMMWKLVTFFESIGLKKKGEELSLSIGDAADKAVGLEGFCKIKHETYNGEKRAKVDKYLVPTAKKAATAPVINEDDMPFRID